MIELLDYQGDIQFNQLSQFIPTYEEHDEMNERVGKIHTSIKLQQECQPKWRGNSVLLL